MLQFPSQSVHISQLCNYGDREKEGIERKREMIVALELQCTVKILFPNKQTITICLQRFCKVKFKVKRFVLSQLTLPFPRKTRNLGCLFYRLLSK